MLALDMATTEHLQNEVVEPRIHLSILSPPEDGEINEMTLPSRYRPFRSSSPDGLGPSTLPFGPRGSP